MSDLMQQLHNDGLDEVGELIEKLQGKVAELEKERDKIDPLLMELLKCCDGLSTEFGQSNYGSANEWVRHIDNAYVKYTDAVDDNTSEKLLQAHNIEQQAKGAVDVTNSAMKKLVIPKLSTTKHEYFKAGIRALAYGIDKETKALKEGK
jgi:hypothetical protein